MASGDEIERAKDKWANARRRDLGDKWNKEDLQDVIFWLRQGIAVIVGLVWGLMPMYGLVGILSFAVINAASLYLYYAKYLGVDDEEHGRWDLLSEGFMPSLALFLVFWITLYSFRI